MNLYFIFNEALASQNRVVYAGNEKGTICSYKCSLKH